VKHLPGHDPVKMIGSSQFDLVHDDADAMRDAFQERSRAARWSGRSSFMSSTAANGDARGSARTAWRFCGARHHRQYRDVTDQKNIQQRIQHLAFHDVTWLPNRSLMQDRVSQAIGRAERSTKRFAVMFIDIDNFKNINDTLGHDVGDELLRQVAVRLTDSVRTHDTIARQGGDEFIVLLDQLEGHQGATRVAQKILDVLRLPFDVGGAEQHDAGSIGIALYPDDGRDAPTLLRNADTAMFHGKGLGKNTYQFFTPQMNIAVKRRAAMESSLRAAVKNGDFTLVYQPQVDLNTGEIVAFEALVRWVSEDSGTMMPGEFIPLAEETGLINDIGKWVLEEACRQAVTWRNAGYPHRRMAINLSARQLADKGFVELLKEILLKTGLDAGSWSSKSPRAGDAPGEGSVMLLNEIADMAPVIPACPT
jgi:diguanylate cyclase (GGDEF)-like protein